MTRSISFTAAVLLSAVGVAAQAPGPAPAPTAGALQLPMVTVTAQKEPVDAQKLPVSVTALSGDLLARAGVREIGEAAIYAPNIYFSDLSARKVSNAYVRGIGSSPANPGITTFLDGVPQLNSGTSRLELIDTEQVEFVRGAQSALFGRNALGGIINITSRLPSLTRWTGSAAFDSMNYAGRGVEAAFSGPIANGKVGVSGAFGARRRDGFTENLLTGTDVDSRSGFFGKAQFLWSPSTLWQARVIVSGERDRDGDYALSDLAALQGSPFGVQRNFEGRSDRDVFGLTALTRRAGNRVVLTTTTGLVRWDTLDRTDLDYSPLPLVTRDNTEDAMQFTQEVRLASAPGASVGVGGAALSWQAGVFLFTQDYRQDAVNSYAPLVLSPFVGFGVVQHTPEADLNDAGVGAFGQVTLATNAGVDLTAGLRVDRESKDATLRTYFLPQIAPDTRVEAERSFSSVSPQVAVAYRLRDDRSLYASVGKGYKAGGFNPASPSGSEEYGEEQAWHVEGGFKSLWANRRATLNASVFYLDWTDLQVNLPTPNVAAQFYIANVGGARSMGAELEVQVRAHERLDLFGAFGRTSSEFKAGSRALGVDIEGNKLKGTPDYTATLAAETSVPVTSRVWAYARAEGVFYGAFKYDETNATGQDAYSLANFRGGVRGGAVFVEGWIRNAFDTRYVPVAFQFPGFPSGYLGEPGRPRTFGISAGVKF